MQRIERREALHAHLFLWSVFSRDCQAGAGMPPPPVNPNHHPHAMPARDAAGALLFGIPFHPGLLCVDFVSPTLLLGPAFLRKGSRDPRPSLADACPRKGVMIWERKKADIARHFVKEGVERVTFFEIEGLCTNPIRCSPRHLRCKHPKEEGTFKAP